MDRQQKILLIALIISLLLHVGFFLLIGYKDLLAFDSKAKTSTPEEVTIVFPENKPEPEDIPREVVQNMNENEEIPDQSNLLSDRNSRARNSERSYEIGNTPMSNGNVPLSNLSNAPSQRTFKSFSNKRFSSKALTGETTDDPRTVQDESQGEQQQSIKSDGSNQMLQQKKFSVEDIGAISLSTYQWEWAPYINAMKNKLERVWYAPTAYYKLGLIHGHTIIRYTIDRSGNITEMEVLHHDGHSSLEISSVSAIKALFPFLPLPEDFPEETLTITVKLIYPDLRARR
jgi:outer membrane biosynthesis protein TonB